MTEFAEFVENSNIPGYKDRNFRILTDFLTEPGKREDLSSDEFADLLTRERRIQANLALLRWSFLCMVEMIKKRIELPSSNEHALYEKFWEAIHCSVRKQVEEFAYF